MLKMSLFLKINAVVSNLKIDAVVLHRFCIVTTLKCFYNSHIHEFSCSRAVSGMDLNVYFPDYNDELQWSSTVSGMDGMEISVGTSYI